MKMYQSLSYQVQDRIAFLTLNRPDQGNALDEVLVVEVRDALLAAQQDAKAKVILLSGEGADFCRGLDPTYLQKSLEFTAEQNLVDASSLAQLLLALYRSPKVVITMVQGEAKGVGAGLVCASDFVLMEANARIAFPEVRQGFVPDLVMPFLLRKVGPGRAREVLLWGGELGAEDVLKMGMAQQIHTRATLASKAQALALEICQRNAFASMQLVKKMLGDMAEMPLENALKLATRMQAHSRGTEEFVRGVGAIQNQQQIEW